MSSKRIGVVTIVTFLVLVASSMIASAATPSSSFNGVNISIAADSNTTVSGTSYASGISFSVANAGWYGDIPITFNVTQHNASQAVWNVAKSANLNVYGYNNNWDGVNQLNFSNSTWFAVNASSPGIYYINVSNPNNASEFVNITVVYWRIDTVLLSGTNILTSAPLTLQAGDYLMYVNVSAPAGVNYQVSGVSLNLTDFGLGWVQLTRTGANSTIGTYNFSGTIQFHTATSTSYNITGNITIGDPTTLPVLNASEVRIIPGNEAKWNIDFPPGKNNRTVGTSIQIIVNATDQYGNVNNTFSQWHNGSISLTVLSGSASASVSPDASVNLNATAGVASVSKFVNVTSAPATVKVEVWGGGLIATSAILEYYPSVHHIELTLSKDALYANNSDTLTLTAQLKDADNNDVKVSSVPITVSEYTTLGLKFNGADTVTVNTDSDGKATITVRAGTKSGTATIRASIQSGDFAGVSGETTVELMQAPNATYSVVSPGLGTITLTAGVSKVITVTLKDYNNTIIANSDKFPVEFNITSGDAKWLENNEKVYEAKPTDANGNVSATLYTENATTTVQVQIRFKNETGEWDTLAGPTNIGVNPNVIADMRILPGVAIGLPNIPGTTQTIIVNLTDAYGNFNTTVSTNMLVTTDNPALGNMTNSTTTVNNNLVVSITNGNGSFTYTVNSSAEGTAVLTLNLTDYGVVKQITITTTGPKGVKVYFNRTLPLVNTALNVTAQLTTADGTDLAYQGVELTLVVRNPENSIVFVGTGQTDSSGSYTWTFLNGTSPGVYTFKASNSSWSISGTNSTAFVGNAVSLEVTVNNTAPQANEAVQINATLYDANGYVTSALDSQTVTFLVNDIEIGTATITNGVASITYVFSEAGDYEITAYYNATLQDSYSLSVGAPVEVVSVTVTPSEKTITVGDGYQFTATAEFSDGTTQDVTSDATWSVSNTTVGEVNDTGYFTALAEGTTYVNATYEGKTGSAFVTVTALLPSEEDTDNDNIPDWMEELFGTDPNTPDQPTEEQVIDAISDKVLEYYSPGVSPEEQAVILQQIIDMVDIYFDLF